MDIAIKSYAFQVTLGIGPAHESLAITWFKSTQSRKQIHGNDAQFLGKLNIFVRCFDEKNPWWRTLLWTRWWKNQRMNSWRLKPENKTMIQWFMPKTHAMEHHPRDGTLLDVSIDALVEEINWHKCITYMAGNTLVYMMKLQIFTSWVPTHQPNWPFIQNLLHHLYNIHFIMLEVHSMSQTTEFSQRLCKGWSFLSGYTRLVPMPLMEQGKPP